MDFSYANTAYSCAGTDEYHYCRIIDYIKDEFRSRDVVFPTFANVCYSKENVMMMCILTGSVT